MKIAKLFRSALVLVASFGLIFVAGSGLVSAQGGILDPACKGDAADSSICKDQVTSADDPSQNPLIGPNGILTRAVAILSMLVGIISVFVIIIGGFRYVTSAGDPNTTASAQKQIIYAVAGIAIAASAQVLIYFILQ